MNKKLVKIINFQKSNVLDVKFWPTDICNYDCSYCFPGSKDDVHRYPKNIDTVIKNFRLLFDVYKERFGKDEITLNLGGGGEPTLWPHIEQFCKEIKSSHNIRIQITSNGSRTLRWWEENSDYFDKVVLSCHNEFVDVDHIIAVADYIHQKDIVINALIPMDSANWDKCVGIVDKMLASKQPWIIEVKTVVQSPGHDIDSYTPEQFAYLQPGLKRIPDSAWILKRLHIMNPVKSVGLFDDDSTSAFRLDELINDRLNYFYNWSCDVALENLVITADGTVAGSCQEKIFKDSNLNMFSDSFAEEFNVAAINLSTIKCSRVQCSCVPDTHISKRKI